MIRAVLGPHVQQLREFSETHPEIRRTTGHMPLEFFSARGGDLGPAHRQE
jgi:hypothetical protein